MSREPIHSNASDYDAVVIGGGPAGLTAALYLGRVRRRTLVVDAGRPRNAKARAAHGVFTRDGTPPSELLAEARRQLATYPTVELRHTAAVSAAAAPPGFEIGLEGGDRIHARKLLLACGIRDEMPPIEGLADHWGVSVLSCNYCDGFEVADRPLAALASGEAAAHAAASLLQLSNDVLVCTDGANGLMAIDRQRIEAHGGRIVETKVLRVSGSSDRLAIHFADGSVIVRTALFISTPRHLASGLPMQLACRLDSPSSVAVDATWQTTVPGVYAAGDIATKRKFVATAAASGAEAAMCLDGALTKEDFGAV